MGPQAGVGHPTQPRQQLEQQRQDGRALQDVLAEAAPGVGKHPLGASDRSEVPYQYCLR